MRMRCRKRENKGKLTEKESKLKDTKQEEEGKRKWR